MKQTPEEIKQTEGQAGNKPTMESGTDKQAVKNETSTEKQAVESESKKEPVKNDTSKEKQTADSEPAKQAVNERPKGGRQTAPGIQDPRKASPKEDLKIEDSLELATMSRKERRTVKRNRYKETTSGMTKTQKFQYFYMPIKWKFCSRLWFLSALD